MLTKSRLGSELLAALAALSLAFDLDCEGGLELVHRVPGGSARGMALLSTYPEKAVLAAEYLGIRMLEFLGDGRLRELGLAWIGEGMEEMVGAIGVQT